MRLPLAIAIIALLSGLLFDWYIISILNRRRIARVYATIAALMGIELLVAIILPRNSGSNEVLLVVMWMLYAYLTFYVARLTFCIFSLICRIPRLWHSNPLKQSGIIAGIVSLAVFSAMWWGALINRFNLEIERIDVSYTSLPESFNGFRILQFSDFHVGTYGDDPKFITTVVDSINSLKPDIILFTGDIVNRRSDELTPFTDILARLSAPYGVYSVLGNHDYGDYSRWPDEQSKTDNLELLLQMQKNMGWHLLNNSHITLKNGSDSLQLIGVENWGEPPFSTYGNLLEAYPTPSDPAFKILLTHNPMHWLQEIQNDSTQRFDLTLSGHTHAMQFEIGKWSPSKWRYPIYDGLYSAPDSTRYIYVSRGIGTVGMPARIGASPVMTLITLHRI